MRTDRAALLVLAMAGLTLAGCQSTSRALGLAPVAPDEFRVVAKAPLVVPPEYSLRPPAQGEPRPQELVPEQAARAALLGRQAAQTRSQGELLLVRRAGGEGADPSIRYVVDDEAGDIAHKDQSFADLVLGWRAPQTAGAAMAQAAVTPSALNAQIEEARLRQLTGGRTVIITRQQNVGFKLPGL